MAGGFDKQFVVKQYTIIMSTKDAANLSLPDMIMICISLNPFAHNSQIAVNKNFSLRKSKLS